MQRAALVLIGIGLALGALLWVPGLYHAAAVNLGYLALAGRELRTAAPAGGKARPSLELLERSLQNGPQNWRSYAGRGYLAASQGRTAESAGYWRAAAALAPDEPVVNYQLGLAYERQGDDAGALQALRRAGAELKYTTEGESLKEAGDLPAAQDRFIRALQINPDWSPAQEAVGEILEGLAMDEIEAGDLPKAETVLLKSLRLAPEYRRAHYFLGLVYYRQGRLSEAEREMLADLGWRPDHAWAHSLLAEIYRAGGREGEARQAGIRAISLFQDLLGSKPANPAAIQAKIGELYDLYLPVPEK